MESVARRAHQEPERRRTRKPILRARRRRSRPIEENLVDQAGAMISHQRRLSEPASQDVDHQDLMRQLGYEVVDQV